MARIFGTHDRRRVTVSAYATGPDDPTGHYRGIVRNASDLFVDAAALTSEATAALIAKRGLDVLIDYDGIHDYNNIKTLSYRPARGVVATWLGFAGSTGQGARYQQKSITSTSSSSSSSSSKKGNMLSPSHAVIDYILAGR